MISITMQTKKVNRICCSHQLHPHIYPKVMILRYTWINNHTRNFSCRLKVAKKTYFFSNLYLSPCPTLKLLSSLCNLLMLLDQIPLWLEHKPIRWVMKNCSCFKIRPDSIFTTCSSHLGTIDYLLITPYNKQI